MNRCRHTYLLYTPVRFHNHMGPSALPRFAIWQREREGMSPRSIQRAPLFQASHPFTVTVPSLLVGEMRSLGASCIRCRMDEKTGSEALSLPCTQAGDE